MSDPTTAAAPSAASGLLESTDIQRILPHRYPFLLVGWFWFIGTLVPVIGLVRAGEQSMADRYSYIPSIGLVCALVWGAASLLRPVMLRAATAVGVGVAVAAAALACALLTRHQVGYWKNDEALFQHALRVTTGNYLAHVNLGSVRDGLQRTAGALPWPVARRVCRACCPTDDGASRAS